MELDELKNKLNAVHIHYSAQELNEIFEIRTKRAVSNVNRKMLWDAILMVIVAAGLIAVTFLTGLKSRYLVSGEIVAMSVLLLIHYRIKYYLLNTIGFDGNIRQAMFQCLNRMQLYMYVYWTVVPLGISLLYLDLQNQLIRLIEPDTSELIVRYALVLPLGLVIFFITRKLTYVLYGQDMDRLRGLIREMDEEEDHSGENPFSDSGLEAR